MEHSSIQQPRRSETAAPSPRWLRLALGATFGVVMVEYLLNALLNPGIAWSAQGVTAHFVLDLLMIAPLAALAFFAGSKLTKRWGMSLSDTQGLLGVVGVLALAFVLVGLPLSLVRDLAHEEFGLATGFSLAEIQRTVVGSDLTIQESTQLCSFGSVRSPGFLLDGGETVSAALLRTARSGARSGLVQLATLLPLLFGVLYRRRSTAAQLDFTPALALARWAARPARASIICIATLVLVAANYRSTDAYVPRDEPQSLYNGCTDGGDLKRYDVSAIDVTITLNRWGDHVEEAFMYTLDANKSAIQSFEAEIEADRTLPEGLDVARVSHGLRQDLIQPLVIRANLGDCLEIAFTNDLGDGDPASLHILGLPHEVTSAGSAVGENPDTMAGPGETIVYQIPVPLDVEAERAYYFHDHGAGRRRQNMGLFGAIAIEPRGATYHDPETGVELDTVTGSNWEAIIKDPNLDGSDDGKSFREFVLMYHEIGDEAFTDIKDRDDKKLPLIDDLAGVYRPSARAINYRSEPFRHRIAQDNEVNGELAGHGKSLGYSSYPFGDPATPIPRSYVGEAVKTRLMHGGSEVFHVHHLHGGGDRWRRNPNADPNNDFWKGLTKVPDPNLTSIHLDSQSIGPGSSYNLEHECGAGGCQQGVGDFLFHCHIGHHYIAGMWSFWRVFGTVQDEETNVYGRPLAMDPDLFQADNVFSDDEATSNTPPSDSVNAGGLIGLQVDLGKTIVADDDFTDPATEVRLTKWIERQLPPPGEPLDSSDATVWDWIFRGSGDGLQVLGAPEETVPFEGYVSDNPGVRPEVRFNPKNGRYVWPLFRPQLGARPPFTARHSGAPWLGEKMQEGRVDGLCAQNGVHPGVDVGNVAQRYYPVSAISLPIKVTADRWDPEGKIFVLNEEEDDIRAGRKAVEPLTFRSNVGDCTEVIFTNKIPDEMADKEFSKQNIHNHFLQFDTQASDGVITGFSYEQSVRPIESEDRTLTANAPAGTKLLSVSNTDRLRPGIWIGVGLGEGTCGVGLDGQPQPCTEVAKIRSLPNANTIELAKPLGKNHRADESVGVEFVRYNYFSDVDFGTVFFHTHVDFKDWDHGLFGTHIVEPKGSTYHDPTTGDEIRAGALADIRVDPLAGGNPVAFGVDGSFREFMLFLQNNNPAEGQFTEGGGTINLSAEPWRRRDNASPALRFSSVTHGDPVTPMVRAYVGDPTVVRGVGLVERVGGVRFTGHRFNMERYTDESDVRDTTFIGISERFDVSLEGGAGGTGGYPGDYLYYSTLGKDFESGAWGLLRVYDNAQGDLQPLPGQPTPPGGDGFPELGFTGGIPPSKVDGPGDACPLDAPVREYSIAATDTTIVYNDLEVPDINGVAYQPAAAPSDITDEVRTPLVLRVNTGECLRVNFRNLRSVRSSISIGEMVTDPQRSYGAAIGLNFDSTVAGGATRTYEYYADRELGVVVAINLGDVDSIERGAFAGVVVEPEGSVYTRPGSNAALPQGGIGVQADITTDGFLMREYVALFSDEDRRLGHNTMPYNVDFEKFAGINYTTEPLEARDRDNRPGDVFKSSEWGDPRTVVSVPAGTPLVYRVAQPWGNQMHLPTLEGHRWPQEPGLEGSEQVFNDVLAPGMSLNLYMVGGAGGDIQAPGDYLFLDRRQPFMEGGLWNILRVTEPDSAGAGVDQVKVGDTFTYSEGGQTWLSIEGRNGIRPAGDTAGHVRIHAGGSNGRKCTGEMLGRARVDRGNGSWSVAVPVDAMPDEICIRSGGGGVAAFQP